MSHCPDNFYRVMGREAAIKLALDAEDALALMDLPEWFLPETFERIQEAMALRRAHDVEVDVTSREEVNGLVSAAMRDNDHLVQAHRELAAYTVGLAQASLEQIGWARSVLKQYFCSNVGA